MLLFAQLKDTIVFFNVLTNLCLIHLCRALRSVTRYNANFFHDLILVLYFWSVLLTMLYLTFFVIKSGLISSTPQLGVKPALL